MKCTRFFIATVSISLLSLHKWKNVANEKGFEKISSFKSFAGGKICRNQNWYAFQVLINSDRKKWYLDKCRHRLHFSCNLSNTNQVDFLNDECVCKLWNLLKCWRGKNFFYRLIKLFKISILRRKFVKIFSLWTFERWQIDCSDMKLKWEHATKCKLHTEWMHQNGNR